MVVDVVTDNEQEDELDLLGMMVANEIVLTAQQNGMSLLQLRKLTKADTLKRCMEILEKEIPAELKTDPNALIIDCDVSPSIPNGWSIEEHVAGGQLEWDPAKVELWLDKKQKNSNSITGKALRKKLAKKKVFNVNVLDYLLANPHLIPEEWKGRYIYFWGTIYRDRDGCVVYVRYLYWGDDAWCWHYDWLGNHWYDCHPAAVLARN